MVPGNAFFPARLHMKVDVKASVFAKAPATPLFRKVRNVPLVKLAEVGEPKAAVMIGNALLLPHPAIGLKWPTHAGPPVALLMARLACAALNSFRKPFSKMLTSLRLSWRQRPVA